MPPSKLPLPTPLPAVYFLPVNAIKMISSPNAPKPLGNYSHAVCYGELIFVSGVASRNPATNEVPGLVVDRSGRKTAYDIRAETRATLENIRSILVSAGSSLERVLDVSVFLTDMKDFPAYNEVYAEFFNAHRPARTTVEVSSLPGNIAIEMKVTAVKHD